MPGDLSGGTAGKLAADDGGTNTLIVAGYFREAVQPIVSSRIPAEMRQAGTQGRGPEDQARSMIMAA